MNGDRLCFVIMPFSSTASCTEEEWTQIFETLIRPSVEGSGLGYRCIRSSPTRGNLIRGILTSLRDAHVVVADLTDLNANVFYELGVRHSLGDRTILLAQNEASIPFDLSPYAYHIYDWRSSSGQEMLRTRIRDLLLELDENPGRPDNPISDFLRASGISPLSPIAHDWWNEPGAPVFRTRVSSTEFVDDSLKLLPSFQQTDGDPPGGLRARLVGAGVEMDPVVPMRENPPESRKYQMKPVVARANVPPPPGSPINKNEIAFEVSFRWGGTDRTIGWVWPLTNHGAQGWHLPADANGMQPTYYLPGSPRVIPGIWRDLAGAPEFRLGLSSSRPRTGSWTYSIRITQIAGTEVGGLQARLTHGENQQSFERLTRANDGTWRVKDFATGPKGEPLELDLRFQWQNRLCQLKYGWDTEEDFQSAKWTETYS